MPAISIETKRIIIIAGLLLMTAVVLLLSPMPAFAGEKETGSAAREVTGAEFEESWIQINLKKCWSNDHGVVLVWSEVPGTKEYQIYRSSKRDGKYTLFATTEEPKLKKDTDGEYFYKVRASNGKEYSHWSRVVQIFSQSGYIKKMYYDDFGYTHFLIHVRNRSDRPVYYFGPGLYNSSRTPLYTVCKYEMITEIEESKEVTKPEDLEYPYPMTAAPKLPMYKCKEVKAGTKGKDIDIYVPWKLPRYGEDGLKNDTYGYRLEICAFPNQMMPGFIMSVTGDEKESRSKGRMDK